MKSLKNKKRNLLKDRGFDNDGRFFPDFVYPDRCYGVNGLTETESLTIIPEGIHAICHQHEEPVLLKTREEEIEHDLVVHQNKHGR